MSLLVSRHHVTEGANFPLLHSLVLQASFPLCVLQASFPALFSRASPSGPITLTLSQPASSPAPLSAQPLKGLSCGAAALSLPGCLHPSPSPFTDSPSFPSQLKEKANLTLAVGTSPSTSVTSSIPENVPDGCLGKTGVAEPASSTLQEVKRDSRLLGLPRFTSLLLTTISSCVGNLQTQNLHLR